MNAEQQPFSTPIIINNFENLHTLRPMVDHLKHKGYTNIIVLDNQSTYPPLLEYYATSPCTVVRLERNYGHLALYRCGKLDHIIENSWYVYTDPDLDVKTLPADFIHTFIRLHQEHGLSADTKIGCALRIDDIPARYQRARDVRAWEAQFWTAPVPGAAVPMYRANIDTTLALHPPGYRRHGMQACRVAGPYTVRHLPWYYDVKNLPENEIYYRYRKTAETGHWSSQLPLPPGSWSMSCAPGARVLPGGRLVARLRRMNGSYANVDQMIVPGRGYGNADGRLVEE